MYSEYGPYIPVEDLEQGLLENLVRPGSRPGRWCPAFAPPLLAVATTHFRDRPGILVQGLSWRFFVASFLLCLFYPLVLFLAVESTRSRISSRHPPSFRRWAPAGSQRNFGASCGVGSSRPVTGCMAIAQISLFSKVILQQ